MIQAVFPRPSPSTFEGEWRPSEYTQSKVTAVTETRCDVLTHD